MPPVTPAPTPVLGLIALWSDRHPSEFPSAAPPCDALGDPSADRVLAAAFKSIADLSDGDRVIHLAKLVLIHTKAARAALLARSERKPELQAYLAMIQVLARWSSAINAARARA
ncbi:hypothetical protein [Devosia sp. Root105]|uniref:hypothetical protein n=1 Tax=Devosia sp. Root105 TaxID=1736423 RepID=UPI0007002BF1|nr:hypothetical protein [Devosia sp. Root105]KQU96475.1 hypothetical protein ASC68_13940 [Devosia sp. Root105]